MRVIILEFGQCRIGNGSLELFSNMFKIQFPYPHGDIDNTAIRLAFSVFLSKLKYGKMQWYPYITQFSNQPNQFWLELQSQEGVIGIHASEIRYDYPTAVKFLKEGIIKAIISVMEEMV